MARPSAFMLILVVTSAGSSALATLLASFLARRRILKCAISSDDLVAEINARGLDLTHHALEKYVRITFQMLGKLGEGQSGEVYRVRKVQTGEIFALKRIEKSTGKKSSKIENDAESLAVELNCLRQLRHRHIVNLVEVIESDRVLWIVMEYAEGGGLYEAIEKANHFSESTAARIVKQVLKATHYMHSMGVVHRDLKAENILLVSSDLDSDVKVADFGLAWHADFTGYHPEESMRMKGSKSITGDWYGTPICMAPEVAQSFARYGPQCDLWSIGCLAHELLSGMPPFLATSADELFRIVRRNGGLGFDDPVWESICESAKDFVKQLLQLRPEDRPSAKEALNHVWFRQALDRHNDTAHSALKMRAARKNSRYLEYSGMEFSSCDTTPASLWERNSKTDVTGPSLSARFGDSRFSANAPASPHAGEFEKIDSGDCG